MISCPDTETLQLYLDELVAEEDHRGIEAHVEACPRCREELERLTAAEADGLPPPTPPDRPARPPADTPAGASQPTVEVEPPAVPGYEVLEELGHGGMSIVYKARHCGLKRLVALKMIRGAAFARPDEVARFRAEAEAIARLQHPHIVQIFEVGDHQGLPYLALEFVEGGSLDQKLGGLPQPPRPAAQLLETLARAVHAAHQRGVVHRDLKPGNVLVTADGTPKVTDFGLAKRLDADTRHTQSGAVVGTPSYMAPEQAQGKVRQVGPANDVFALGAILYELLTGRPPFLAENAVETVLRVLADEPVPPRRLQPKVPRDLETICLKCLEKEPRRRYAGADVLADRLRLFLDGKPIPDRPVGRLGRLARWGRRKPAVAGLLAALALLLVAAAAGGWYLHRRNVEAEKANHATGLVARLKDAEVTEVPAIVAELDGYRRWADPLLREVVERPLAAPEDAKEKKARLHARLALLPVDAGLAGGLLDDLLGGKPAEVLVIRGALLPHKDRLGGRLWRVAEDGEEAPQRRLRAAAALAAFDPYHPRWPAVGRAIVPTLVAENLLYLGQWLGAFRPVCLALLGPLGQAFRDPNGDRAAERSAATSLLAEYAKDRPEVLAELIKDADARQYALLLPRLEEYPAQAVASMREELEKRPRPEIPQHPSWSVPSPELVHQVEGAQGAVTEYGAWCQALPLDRFDGLAEKLRLCGYRPVRLRPYLTRGTVEVAAVWVRDGGGWQVAYGVSGEDLVKLDGRWRASGYLTVDAAVYRVGTTSGAQPEYCAAVWAKIDGKGKAYPADAGTPELGYKGLAPGVPPDSFFVRRRRLLFLRLLRSAERDLQGDPSNVEAKLQRVRCHLGLGNNQAAIRGLSALIGGAPNQPDAYALRAVAYARLGRVEEARGDQSVCERLSPEPGSKARLGAFMSPYAAEVMEGMRRPELALAASPEDPEVLYDAAVAHAEASRVFAERATAVRILPGGPGGQALLQVAAALSAWKARAYADQAVALLREAVARGYPHPDYIERDVMLEGIARHAGFATLVRQTHLDRQYNVSGPPPGPAGAQWLLGLEPGKHGERCRQIASQGYHPVVLSFVQAADDGLLASSVWLPLPVSDEAKDYLARRQANAAVTLLHMGRPDQVWPLLRHSEDPRLRTFLLHRLSPLGIDPQAVIRRLDEEPDVSARRALVLSLGEFKLTPPRQRPVADRLLQAYRDDPDPGYHSAVGWLLQRWGYGAELGRIDRLLAVQEALAAGLHPIPTTLPLAASLWAASRPGERWWFINGHGQTFTVVPQPVEFPMGSPAGEPYRVVSEKLHRRSIPRAFAIATKEVTVGEFRRFWQAVHPGVDFYNQFNLIPGYGTDDDGPILGVSWFHAVQYCRWLSEQEGIPEDQMCYPKLNDIKPGMELAGNNTERSGYRLPIEPEWEYACRAGAVTSRFYGSSEEMLGSYAWFPGNSQDRAQAVGSRMPNDLGMFDMYGNAWEWCQDPWSGYPVGPGAAFAVDQVNKAPVTGDAPRILRGGAFDSRSLHFRSASRWLAGPQETNLNANLMVGLRVARTYR